MGKMKRHQPISLTHRRGNREKLQDRDCIAGEPQQITAGTHRGNGIDGVQDGKEKHTVDAPGVI